MHRDVIVAGATGKVGSAFVSRVCAHGASGAGRAAPDPSATAVSLRLCATLSSARMSFDRRGVAPDRLAPETAWDRNWGALVTRVTSDRLLNPVLVDCTAAQELADAYPRFLRAGISLVSANKIAWSGSSDFYRELDRARIEGGASVAYGTTVGAALPMLQVVRAASRSGDEVLGLEGVLSGTLSFVLSRVNDGVSFSRAVGEARDRGLTEPNPREDLRGRDVARKLLILLREAGRELDPVSVTVESLVPPQLEDEPDAERFVRGLTSVDAAWAERAEAAALNGTKLVYVAASSPHPHAGVRAVPVDAPLARLAREDGALELRTRAYRDAPLFLSGPGAGPAVTAMGVFSDLMEISGTGPRRAGVS